MAQRAIIAAIRIYQITLSPVLAALLGPASHCRFQPTCSRYAVEAIRLHGAIYGGCLAARRLARCHPWGKFGADPVPLRRVTPGLETANSRLGCCHHGS